MLKAMWSFLAILIILWTLIWVLRSNTAGTGLIAGITLIASIGYIIIIFLVIFLIYFIVKKSIEKYG